MNLTHLHLMITHLPIFGSVIGSFVLINGIWSKNRQTTTVAYYIFLISAIGSCIAYLTGEEAEETVENIKSVSEKMIELHEDSAMLALISFIVLGILSIAAIFANSKNLKLAKSFSVLLLFLSMVSFGLVARTGYLGGQIRHTEIAGSGQNFPAEDGDHFED